MLCIIYLLSYVDTNRMLAVNLYQSENLKEISDKAKQRTISDEHGEINEFVYIKLAEYFITKGHMEDALQYSQLALRINPYNLVSVCVLKLMLSVKANK